MTLCVLTDADVFARQDERAQREKLESERTQLEAQSAAFREDIEDLRQKLESSRQLAAGSQADEQIRLPI
jgi:Skp family chaperone for outer membrane proteins